MTEEKIILSNWLTNRFEIDAKARNKQVENIFLDSISGRSKINLIDLGSGTGGNLVYLLAKIKCHQNWFLIEQDAVLIEACKQRLSEMFECEQLADNKITFKIEDYTINLTWHHNDIVDFIESNKQQAQFDIVTASALLDVLPKETFQHILNFVRSQKLMLYCSLNYEKTVFENATKTDFQYAALYQQHMKLPQSYGIKMGGDCKAAIFNALNELEQKQLKVGASNWLLNEQHPLMLKQLIQFFAESIPDLLNSEKELQEFRHWVDLKNQQISNQQLSVVVEHFDFLLGR